MGGPRRIFLRSCCQILVLTQTSRLLSASPIQRSAIRILENSCPAISSLERFKKLIEGFRTCSSMPGVAEEEKFTRLPTHAVPSHYKIKLVPDLETFEFLGEQTVDLEVHTHSASFCT